MSNFTVYNNSTTYAELDQRNPGSGLRLWMHRYGLKPYEPEHIAGLGAPATTETKLENCTEEYRLNKMGYSS